MSLLNLINPASFNDLKSDTQGVKPFPHFCIDNFLDEAFANEVHDSFPSYEESKTMGKEFSAVNEKYKIQICDTTRFSPAILKLHQLLASPEFIDMVSRMMGIPNLLPDPELMGGGIHETNAGGRLDVHVDFNFIEKTQWHRRVNILIYFNKDWKEEYGGYLDLWDKDVKHCVGAFAPIFNRACGFATSEISYHGVTPVRCPPGRARKSFAVYYYTKEAPAGWDGVKHSTVFKARPDEWLKGHLLMPAEDTLNSSKQAFRNLKKTVKTMIG
ncbi:2OG-Fe(II) oxygenase [Methylotuvimicrobium sp.]|uniref:2OG-Fe(II) oxygenase n=1 Tax=Methylotuvimicrobium sp. TaxID=2822413 RepID=UPI003D648A3B